MIKNFSIFKNNKKEEGSKHPDYNMSISGDEGQPMINIGGCWLRESKSGTKYFSCKLNDAYVDHTKGFTRKGYNLTEDKSENPPEAKKNYPSNEEVNNIPF